MVSYIYDPPLFSADMAQAKVRVFQRKLQALDYHAAKNIDVHNPEDLKALVVWLEDQKIRQWKIEERGALRSNTGQNWRTTFKEYLNHLECPYDPDNSLNATVDWLLGVAVRYEFNECASEHPELRHGLLGASVPSGDHPPKPSTAGGKISALDINPKEELFQRGVEALAKILEITRHPDPTVLLAACRIVIQEKLSESALQAAKEKLSSQSGKNSKGASQSLKGPKHFQITPKDCGFDIGDPVLSEAAKALRLLHLQELRALQTDINRMIVALQALTADPKTNQALGKVGK